MPERGRETGVLSDDGCAGGRTTCHYVPRDSSERKARREIANSNERRRMQSINAGFQSLRKMLQPRDGDKLSKASVLQKAVEYICALENDRSYLIACNERLTRRLRALGCDICEVDDDDDDDNCTRFSGISAASSMSKRRKLDTESSSDEGIGGMLSPKVLCSELSADGPVVEALRRQVADLQRQLEQRQRRMSTEFDVSRHHRGRGSIAANTATPRRGSLETIVEAIRCLEGDSEKAESKPKLAESCRRAAADSEELVVAAKALQFIATGPRGGSSTQAARWQRDLADFGSAWQGCR